MSNDLKLQREEYMSFDNINNLIDHGWKYDYTTKTFTHEGLDYPKEVEINEALLVHRDIIEYYTQKRTYTTH